jgi:predicted acylesterase/phospholipase RssA
MVKELIDHLGWRIDGVVAEALIDGHYLRHRLGSIFPTPTADASRCAPTCWMRAWRSDLLYHKLFQCDRPERLKLMVRMLESLELTARGGWR